MSGPEPAPGWWQRWRTTVVVVPALVLLLVAGGVGARMLFAAAPEHHDAAVDVCWDDTEAPAGTCPLPVGTDGLGYVFPGFDPRQPECEQRTFADPESEAVEWRCTAQVRGENVEIAYRMRPPGKTGLGYLRKVYADAQEETSVDGDRAIWRPESPDRSGRYVFATAYLDYPYTLTLWASSPQLRDTAAAELARFRPTEEITGRRA